MTTKRILFVVTSNARLGDTDIPTGLWLETFAAPYYTLLDEGYACTVASIGGGRVPVDPRSAFKEGLEQPDSVKRFRNENDANGVLHDTPALGAVGSDFSGIVLCGGYGCLGDFPDDPHLARLVVELNNRGSLVAAIDHGAAGFLSAHNPDGTAVIHGRPLCCYSRAETERDEMAGRAGFSLQDRLSALGAILQLGAIAEPKVIRTGNLVTAQNKESAFAFGQELVWELEQPQTQAQSAQGA
jgi:putative intracellular protease/amidase